MADILDGVIRMSRQKAKAAPFPVGAMVALNSGGAWMTVRSCEGDVITVDWQINDGEPVTATYLAAMLTDQVPPEEKSGA